MTFVKLRIYSFKFGIFTELHTEIVAYKKSYSFSDNGIEISEITNKHNIDGYILIETIYLGFSGLSERQFDEKYLPKLVTDYTIDTYNLFRHNCRSFSLDMIKALRPSRPDVGLQLTGELLDMSKEIGRWMDSFIASIRDTVINRNFPATILFWMFTVTTFWESGRIFRVSEAIKDMILIQTYCFLFILFLIIRLRM